MTHHSKVLPMALLVGRSVIILVIGMDYFLLSSLFFKFTIILLSMVRWFVEFLTGPKKTNTEMHTGLYILPNFKFWAVFGRRGCLNKSPNLSILLKIKSDQNEVQYSFLCSLFSGSKQVQMFELLDPSLHVLQNLACCVMEPAFGFNG